MISPTMSVTCAQDTPSQCHLASFAIDRRIEVPFTKCHEAPLGPISTKRSVRSFQRFLQHFEKRALGEMAGAQNVSTQHHDTVFIGFRVVGSYVRDRVVSIC
jgi:hypothetical protein